MRYNICNIGYWHLVDPQEIEASLTFISWSETDTLHIMAFRRENVFPIHSYWFKKWVFGLPSVHKFGSAYIYAMYFLTRRVLETEMSYILYHLQAVWRKLRKDKIERP